MKHIYIALLLSLSVHAVEIGKVPPKVTLSVGDSGKSWSSQSLRRGKHLVIYMDPDERKNVEPLLQKIQHLKTKRFTTVAIVNLAATWMPNSVLISKLKEKQKSMKKTIYLFDKQKTLVKKWGLKDDNTIVMVLGPKGKLKLKKTGKLSGSDVREILKKLQS